MPNETIDYGALKRPLGTEAHGLVRQIGRHAGWARHALGKPSTLLAILAIALSSLLLAGMLFGFREISRDAGFLAQALAQRSAEWLFFIGTTYVSLLLLRQRKWIKAKLVFGCGVLWVVFHQPVTEFFNNLGGDSFSEAHHFDVREALFWLETLGGALKPNFNWKAMLCYLLLATGSYLVLRVLLRRRAVTTRHYSYVKFSIAAIVIGVAIHQTVSEPLAQFIRNTEVFTETSRNFSNLPPAIVPAGEGADLLVYIGESTSTMNMGIYGYPRDTTPSLRRLKDTDPNLLVFANVFSTHTHTSSSLLEAFSFAIHAEENYLPINKRKRVSLVDVLAANRLRTTLVSNQGQSGTWNLASSIIFSRAPAIYSSDTRKVGNNDDKIARPWDDEFFARTIGQAFDGAAPGPQVAFFHSYSGHGGYYDNIPAAYRKRVDDRYRIRAGEDLPTPYLERIEEYDAAIRYVDSSVSRAIGYVRASARPMIFVYFSDHGDAPFAGRAHDSSQFVHEMARVPFVLYFNAAARLKYPDKYARYRALSAAGTDATLAQLPSTLLDLLNLKIAQGARDAVVETPVIGEQAVHPPLVVRETGEGITYVNINRFDARMQSPLGVPLIDRSDDATREYLATKSRDSRSGRTCYRGTDSYGALLRSRLVADCVELAIRVDRGIVAVRYPAGGSPAVSLREVLEVAEANKMGLWLDARDVRGKAACEALARSLRASARFADRVLVEFPPGSHQAGRGPGACAAGLAAMGTATAYRVPDADALACVRELSGRALLPGRRSCTRLRNDLAAAHRSGLFTDISFDHGALAAVESVREAGFFRWNARALPPRDIGAPAPAHFRMTIVGNGENPPDA